VLGLPSFALALAVTTVSSFGAVLVSERSGPLVTGLLIGLEGVFAIVIPPLVGRRSDRLSTRLGPRLPFLLAAAPVAAVALVALPLAGSLGLLIVALSGFYAAYFVYFSPYWALYADLVPEHARGRSQGVMGLWRELGLGLALIGGGLLIAVWRPLPFVLAAVAVVVVTAAFTLTLRRLPAARATGGDGVERRPALDLVRERPALRAVLAANALWELALAALRAFVVLFFTIGLGRTTQFSSLVLAGVAVAAVAAAPLSGTLADRWGRVRVLQIALWLYGLGLLLPALTQSPLVLVAVPVVALAAATVMTLPFSLLMGVLPPGEHGLGAGLFGLSRGVGLLLGPLLAGLAIELLEPVFSSTQGYAAVFVIAAAAILASIPVLRRAGQQERTRDADPRAARDAQRPDGEPQAAGTSAE
jgi:MFS family permease